MATLLPGSCAALLIPLDHGNGCKFHSPEKPHEKITTIHDRHLMRTHARTPSAAIDDGVAATHGESWRTVVTRLSRMCHERRMINRGTLAHVTSSYSARSAMIGSM